jgi:hypothetical protein
VEALGHGSHVVFAVVRPASDKSERQQARK